MAESVRMPQVVILNGVGIYGIGNDLVSAIEDASQYIDDDLTEEMLCDLCDGVVNDAISASECDFSFVDFVDRYGGDHAYENALIVDGIYYPDLGNDVSLIGFTLSEIRYLRDCIDLDSELGKQINRKLIGLN
jgi:hypothetical protein